MLAERNTRTEAKTSSKLRTAGGMIAAGALIGAGIALATERRTRRNLETTTVVPPVEIQKDEPDNSAILSPQETPKAQPTNNRSKAKIAGVLAAGVGVILAGHELYKGKSHSINGDTDGSVGKTVAKVVGASMALGASVGVVDALRTTLDEHRTKTHQSTKLHPWLTKVFEAMARSLGQSDPRVWPDAHLDHHASADVNKFRFLQVSRALDWLETQGKHLEVKIPKHIDHLDPLVDNGRYPIKMVRQIGKLAEQQVWEKLGDLYQPPTEYTQEEVMNILHPQEPDYTYPSYKKKRRGDYTSDDMTKIILRDPHSPVYADKKEKNGVKKILLKGLWPYVAATDLRSAHPEIISPHLKLPEGTELKSVKPAMAASVAIPALAVLLARGKYAPKDFAIAAGGAVAAVATRVAFVAGGSMAVNSLGHAGGELSTRKIVQAAFGREFEITLNPDGSVSADTTSAGFIGNVINKLTADEVGRQKYHHDKPWRRKYTDENGAKGRAEALWGSAIEWMVKSKSTLIEPGNNFGLQPGERRPDEPDAATLLIMERRKEQYEINQRRKAEQKTVFTRSLKK